MGRVRCIKLSRAAFEAILEKDDDALYFVNETGTFGPDSLETDGDIYLGDKILTETKWINITDKPTTQLASGLKIYYNGVDVTNNSSMQQTVANASSHWYGSQEDYNELVLENNVQNNVAYHIKVQTNWSETTDPNSLAYIKNKPDFLLIKAAKK